MVVYKKVVKFVPVGKKTRHHGSGRRRTGKKNTRAWKSGKRW